MRTVLAEAGRSFLHLFIAALVVYGAGLDTHDLHRDYLIATCAIIASIAAGLVGVLTYLPEISWVTWLGHPLGDWLDAFTYAVVSSLVITLPGVLGAPDFHTVHAIIVGCIVGAVSAGVRAIEGLLTPGEHPLPANGLPRPQARPS